MRSSFGLPTVAVLVFFSCACGGGGSPTSTTDDAGAETSVVDVGGSEVVVDADADAPPSCTPGASCATADRCHQGSFDCTASPPVCAPTTPLSDGTSCGDGLVCASGVCVACVSGAACVAADGCHVGQISCATGVATCMASSTAIADGTACGTGMQCLAGACVAGCTEGDPCAISGSCFVGFTSCNAPAGDAGSADGGTATCLATSVPASDGTSCGTDQVCRDGACVDCKASQPCIPSAAPCHVGTTSCTGGALSCTDTMSNAVDGSPCGTGEVCSAGACVACVAGQSCVPANPCHAGTTTCGGGSSACLDTGGLVLAGTTCGTGLVCGADGNCGACADGVACTPATDPCHVGAIACTSGSASCVTSTTPVLDGTSCGTGLVCHAGACTTCVAGTSCVFAANPCHVGVTSCASGVSACVDSGTTEPDGVSCSTGNVCASGSCVACVDAATCTPKNSCHVGTTTCGSGKSACVDTGALAKPGSSCATGSVCAPDGACVACASGTACTPTSNPCHVGTIDCSTGESICIDTGKTAGDGTTCGTNEVCHGGACATCKASQPCAFTGNACHVGITSCATGVSSCVDATTNMPDGTSCGTGDVCASGSCVACVDGTPCKPTSFPCHVGVTSCAGGASACIDTGAAAAVGLTCGTNMVCAAGGACDACTTGTACIPVTNPCHSGATSCTTGVSQCLDSGKSLVDGTGCGGGAVCHTGVCTTCVAGGACVPTNTCDLGVYSCATGLKTCVDSGPDGSKTGSACGASAKGLCAAGTCACETGYDWNGTDCVVCPAATGSTLYVNAGTGVDDACCGALNATGIGGACRTVTQAMKNVKGTGWTISATCNAGGTAASEETYPISLSSGVTLGGSGACTFGGPTSEDIIVVDDGSTVSIQSIGIGPAVGSSGIEGRHGVVVESSPSGVASKVILSNVTVHNVSGDAIHIDGGSVVANLGLNVISAGNAAVWCASQLNPLVPSTFDIGGASGAYSIAATSGAAEYGLFAGHNCTIGGTYPVGGPVGAMLPSGVCSLDYPIWLEDNASLDISLHVVCARHDGVSLHASSTGGSGVPSLYSDSGGYGSIADATCSNLRVDAGHARVVGVAISGGRWGVVQSSALSSAASSSALIDLSNPGTCAFGGTGATCANIIDSNNVTTTAATCCPTGSPCAPPADILNNSGLPLIATNDTIGKCPLSTCTCNSAFASCTCTGAAAGDTTPPAAGVTLLEAPLSAGTPTVTTTGSTCSP